MEFFKNKKFKIGVASNGSDQIIEKELIETKDYINKQEYRSFKDNNEAKLINILKKVPDDGELYKELLLDALKQRINDSD